MHFDRSDPYPHYSRARETPGLTFVPELGAWLVVRHADARTVLRDPEAFSSANALKPDVVPGPEAVEVLRPLPAGRPVVLTADGDDHRRVREPLTRGLSPKRVAAAVPFITTTEEQVAAAGAVAGMKRALDAHVRSRADADDLCGELVRAIEPHGTLISNLQNLMLAGHLTTTALIGTAVLHLLRNREQWELLCERPELIPAAVEEAARYDTAIQGFRRVATRPVTLAGTELPEGAEVFVAFGAAGRDPGAHERPDEFDITRKPARHLAFGHGVHACPGAQLAREQVRITLETLTRELPGLRLEGPVEMLPNLIHRSPKELVLTW